MAGTGCDIYEDQLKHTCRANFYCDILKAYWHSFVHKLFLPIICRGREHPHTSLTNLNPIPENPGYVPEVTYEDG